MAKEEVGKAAGDLPTEIEEHKSNDSVIIEIPEPLDRELWSKCCILRVHTKLRKVNEAAYTPQILSIGPFHHGKKELLGMEPHKRRYLDEFCKRFGKNQVELRHFIRDHYDEILQSYAGTVKVKGEAFIEMVLVDACFIIELFLRNLEDCEDDYILNTPWLCLDIVLDLIMLENQLPYAFLKLLYDFVATLQAPYWEAIGDSGAEIEQSPEKVPLLSSQHHNRNADFHPFSKLIHDFFYDTKDIGEEPVVDGIKHFTDLARQKLCPMNLGESFNEVVWRRRATEDAGGFLTKQNKCGGRRQSATRGRTIKRRDSVRDRDGGNFKNFQKGILFDFSEA